LPLTKTSQILPFTCSEDARKTAGKAPKQIPTTNSV
jgi:hypothetical protein